MQYYAYQKPPGIYALPELFSAHALLHSTTHLYLLLLFSLQLVRLLLYGVSYQLLIFMLRRDYTVPHDRPVPFRFRLLEPSRS